MCKFGWKQCAGRRHGSRGRFIEPEAYCSCLVCRAAVPGSVVLFALCVAACTAAYERINRNNFEGIRHNLMASWSFLPWQQSSAFAQVYCCGRELLGPFHSVGVVCHCPAHSKSFLVFWSGITLLLKCQTDRKTFGILREASAGVRGRGEPRSTRAGTRQM